MANDGIPALEDLGRVVPDEGTVVVEAPAATETPKAKTEPEKPAAKADPEPKAEPAEDFATLEDVTASFVEALKQFDAATEAKAAERAELEGMTDEQRALYEKDQRIKALEADAAKHKAAAEEAEQKALEQKLAHEVSSTAGKLKMTDEEVELTGKFFEEHPEYFGVWSFERAALHVNPDIKGRLATAPPAQPRTSAAPGGDGEATGVVTEGAVGPAKPQPPKYNGRRYDYSDISAEVLRSGEAASLGRYI